MIRSLFDRFPLLSTRLSVYIFCAAVVPLLLFSFVVYRLYAKEHYSNQLEHLEFVRDDRTQRISSWFEERRRDLVYFSGQIEASIRESDGKIDGTSPSGIGFVSYGRTHSDIEGVLLLNGKGDVIRSSRNFRDLDGNDVTNIFGTQVFSEMIKHRSAELYVSGWFKSSMDGVPRMYLSRCISQGPEVVAVLAIEVNINKWVEFFQNRKGLSAEEEVLVYSDDGQSQNPTGWDEKGKGLFSRGSGAVGLKSLKELFSGRAIEGIDHRGVPVVAVRAPVPLTDFTLAVKCDSAQFYRHVRWAFLGGSLLILLIMGLSALGARWLARKITEPFRILSRTAVEISMGNLYARTRLKRGDEIGRLADAFDTATEKVQNQMVELERLRSELKQERDELDRKVRERTEELRRTNSISRAIADYTVDWELWLSPTGQLRWTNPACEKVTGYSVEEMLCTPDFWRLISEGSTRRMFLTLFRAALDGMNGEKVEFRCRKKDGSLIWLRVSWQRIYDSDGTYIGMRASAHDVTFEVDQRLENQRLAEVVNQSSAAVAIRDRDGIAVYVNGAFLRMFGVAPDDVIAKDRSDFFARYTGEESVKTVTEIESCIGEGCRWEGAVTNRRASGESFITQTLVFPVRSEDGSIVNYVESRVDITSELENKNRLRQMASAVEQCTDGVIIRELVKGKVLYVNDAFLRITGRSRDYVLQSNVPGAGPNMITNCSPNCSEVVWTKETWHEICEQARPDGTSLKLDCTISPICDEAGNVVYGLGFFRDVTKEVAVREDLRRMSTAVEQAVVAVLIRDLNGCAIYANRAYLNLFGITWNELQGKKLGEDFPRSAESIRVRQEAISVLAENRTWRRLYPENRKDGSRFWVSNTTSRINDSNGKFVYQLSYMLDVSEDVSLHARADALAKIVEQSRTGIVVVDRNLKIAYVNEALLSIYHAERGQVEGRSVLDYVRFSHNRSVFSRALRTVLRGESWQSQFQNVRVDGEPFEEDVIASPLTDSDGTVSQIAIYCRDVTEEVKARAEVERLGIVLNQSVTAMMIADSSARVEFANDSFFALTGFNRDEVVGRNIRNIPFGLDFEKDFAAAFETLEDGRPWMGYFNPPKTGGQKTTLNVFVSPVKDGAGRPTSYLMNFWDVTEEIKNRAEVSRLAQVVEQSANAIVIKTLDLKVLYVNQAYSEMTGLAKAEVIGKTAQEIGLDLISAETYAKIRRTVLAGETWTGRVNSCRKDGTSCILKMVASPVFDTQGAVMNLVVNKQNITEEVAAINVAERLGEVLQQSSLAMLVSGSDHVLTDVNEAFLTMHGVRREDMLGRSVLHVPVPESMLDLARQSMPVLERGEMFSGEYVLPAGVGGERVCETVVTPVLGKDGQTLYHLAIFRDISHEVETRNRMLQLVQVIEQSPYVVEITNKEGRLIYVNAAFSLVSGYAPEEALGRFVWDVQAAAVDQDVVGEVWKSIRGGNVWHGDLTCERKNGTQFVMRSVIAPIRNEKGDIVSFVATKMDISPMLELETQMRQAQKMESIGRLAGGIAHDFNNMLQGIMGFAELLDLDTEGNSALNVNVKEIQRAAGRARDLTRQLLAFGRKQQSRPQQLDLNAHIRNMEKMLGRLLSVNTPLSIALDESLPQVMADPGQVEQAVMNLVLNARDAVAQVNYARIAVTGRDCFVQPQECIGKPEMSPGHYVCVSVSDNGCGIPAELCSRIFEPFFTTKENEKGTGLGLSVAYGIMKQHHGWIGLDSVVGKGTTFNLYFPVAEGDAKDVAVSVAAPAGQEVFKGHGQIILVVEDEDLVRDLAVQNLKRAGYEVLTAATAPHGLKMFMQNRNRVALLFSDVVLLDGTGVELADHIRKMVPELPVLLTSGFSREHLDNRNLETDNYGFLPKPYAREDMLKAIFTALQAASRGNT